jgi:hypothetical protein
MIRNKQLTAKEKELLPQIANVTHALTTGGFDVEGNYMTIQDALNVPNAGLIFSRAVTEVIQSSIQPRLIGTSLIRVLRNYTNDSQIIIRTLGAIGSIDFEVPEEGEYPEVTAGRGQNSYIRSDFKKYGVKIKVSEESIKQSQWDIVQMYIQEAVNALARHKDRLIFDMLESQGRLIFDNANPTSAEIGRTGGRNITGAGNGSMTYEDLIDMYSSMVTRGFRPNVILVHPMHWAMFAKDPIIREAGVMQGDISQWLNSQVNPYNAYDRIGPWNDTREMANGSRQNLSAGEQDLLTTSRGPTMAGLRGTPLAGITVLTSENVPYDPVTKTASVLMIDTENSGALIIAEDLMIDEWDEKTNDIKVIKLREKYTLASLAGGEGIAIARNVSLEPNEMFVNPQVHVDNVQPIVRK